MNDGAPGLPRTPDFRHWPIANRIVAAAVDPRWVCVQWDDGRDSRFHFRWLRDGCACSRCVSPKSREQLLDISRLAPDLRPLSADIDPAGALTIVWPDAHVSRYHPGWLRALDYSNAERTYTPRRVPELWDASFAETIPSFDGRAILTDDHALQRWLSALERYGLTRLVDVAREDDGIERIAERIGVLRPSNFGRTFDVRSKLNPESNAYTPVELVPHTDLPTRETQPGIQMLHCLRNTARGGESVMVDGFMLAKTMRREAPDLFNVLTSTPIEFASRSPTSEYRHRAPMIELDACGNVREVRPGALLRAPLDVPFDRMEELYDAIQCFCRLSADARLRAVFPIEEGNLLAFDNRRVMHGRNAYDAHEGERHLKGCYIDRDELLSRLRVLERGAV